MNRLKPIVLAAVVSLLILGCSSSYFEGTLVGSKNLEGFKFWLIFIDSKGMNHRYYIKAEQNGHFKTGIRDRGIYDAYVTIGSLSSDWHQPRMTLTDLPSFQVDTRTPGTHQLPPIYVAEPVIIYSPKPGTKIPLKSNYQFSWSPDRIIDFYCVTVYRKDSEGKPHSVLTIGGVKSNQIGLSEMIRAAIAPAKQDYSTIVPGKIFKRQVEELSPGEYWIAVEGVVAVPSERRYMVVTESKSDLEPAVDLY